MEPLLFSPPDRVELGPGVFHFPGFLAMATQCWLWRECEALVDGPVPAYIPIVRGGGRMHVRMLCLGRHWNGKTYGYEGCRSDYDGLPAPPLPAAMAALAIEAARQAGMALAPDICIVNFYDRDGRMGLHQDKDESDASLAAGVPVVSLSLGDTARFLLGGQRRRDEVVPIALHSGDALVFGGPGRLRYHGVSRIIPGSSPRELAVSGRFNLTFRQY
jgi:DNA alkylation damage repair protein AlkB